MAFIFMFRLNRMEEKLGDHDMIIMFEYVYICNTFRVLFSALFF